MDRFNPAKREKKHDPELVQEVSARAHVLGVALHLVNAAQEETPATTYQFPKRFVSPNYVPAPSPDQVIDLHEDIDLVDDQYLAAMGAPEQDDNAATLDIDVIRRQVADVTNEDSSEMSDELAA